MWGIAILTFCTLLLLLLRLFGLLHGFREQHGAFDIQLGTSASDDFQGLVRAGAGAGLTSAVGESLFLAGHATSGVTNTHGNLL